MSPARDKTAYALYQKVTARKTSRKMIKLELSGQRRVNRPSSSRGEQIMKRSESVVILATFLLGLAGSSSAWAHGGGHHHHGHSGVGVGIVIGTGIAAATYSNYPYYYGYPRYYYPPAYYYPAPVVTMTPPAPPVYVEQQPLLAAAPQASGYWYYCSNPQGYYPSVQTCPQGWQKILPQPPSTQ
jgi:hypothetical protein